MLKELFKSTLDLIQSKVYEYSNIREEPSDWVEKNVYLTSAESRYAGYFNYDRSPYSREVIDCLSTSSDVEMVAVMKCSQSGFTAGVVTAVIPYIMSQCPSNILFLSGSEKLVQDTVRDRLDPIIHNNQKLKDLVRPSIVKKKNQKSGDTDFKKEFAGGSLTALTYLPSKLRFYSAKFILADEFDDAPRNDKKEGSIRSLLEQRAKSFGGSKKIAYISTPTISGQSNIEDVFNEGDKRKWNWCCPNCKEYIPIEWRIEKEDGTFAGIKYTLDSENRLIEDSVYYECQKCGGKINYNQKYELNLSGKWIATAVPKHPKYRSYLFNALCIPPGFDTWTDLVRQWIGANPKDEPIDEGRLKTFINTQLGQTWTERGNTPRVNEMMQNNVRSYNIGIVPDTTIANDGNGKVVLLSLACDLGGVMETNNEDVRLDWELIAHTSKGVTYSVDHGSIGTFKRSRKKSTIERENESNRDKYTYSFGQTFSVWPYLTELVERNWIGQSGDAYNIDITIIDTGHFTKLSYDYIKSMTASFVIGIKGYGQDEYRKLNRDTPVVKRSTEMQGQLYILQVNQLKEILASNMKIKMGMDGFQPSGFMNFPMGEKGKYSMRSYFSHFESEHRVPEMKNDVEVGFAWKKKNSSVENHFFDVYVYNLAAPFIYIDILRRSHSQNAKLTWEDYIQLVE